VLHVHAGVRGVAVRLYRNLSIATAALSLCLFVCLLLFPGAIFALFGLQGAESAEIMSRRASMLFLGFSVICWSARNAQDSTARQAVTAGLAASMLGLAGTGLYELGRGGVGLGVLPAMAAEVIIGSLYARVWFASRVSSRQGRSREGPDQQARQLDARKLD
jgi:hypothetical protein